MEGVVVVTMVVMVLAGRSMLEDVVVVMDGEGSIIKMVAVVMVTAVCYGSKGRNFGSDRWR